MLARVPTLSRMLYVCYNPDDDRPCYMGQPPESGAHTALPGL